MRQLSAIKNYSHYSDKDVCTIEGFFNDWVNNKPLGNYTDSTEEYYYCPKCGFIMGEPIKEQINKTTEQRAIDLLNAFTKTWCMDYEATEKSDDVDYKLFGYVAEVESFIPENGDKEIVKENYIKKF